MINKTFLKFNKKYLLYQKSNFNDNVAILFSNNSKVRSLVFPR